MGHPLPHLLYRYYGNTMSKPLNRAHIVINACQDFVQVPFNVALKNKTSEDVSLLVIDSIVDGNENFQHIRRI